MNAGEQKAFTILDKALAGSLYRVFAQMRVKDAVDIDENHELPLLPRAQQNIFRYGHFDFVCVEASTLLPRFVIEFDGPYHELEAQKRRDAAKNSLCRRLHLPLLRLGIEFDYLRVHDRVSVLEFVATRFVAWEGRAPELWDEFRKQAEEIGSEVLSDPAYDPTVVFHLDSPFPGTTQVARSLFEKHRIIADGYLPSILEDEVERLVRGEPLVLICHPLLIQENVGDYIEHAVEMVVRRVKSCEYTQQSHWSSPYTDIVFRVKQRVRMRSVYPTEEGDGARLLAGLPGASIDEVVELIAEYFALRRIGIWADKNL